MASVKEQQLAALMKRVYDERTVKQQDGEPVEAFYGRLRKKAVQIQRQSRRVKTRSARAARKRNRG